jgi:hypothetical protein
MAKCLKKGATVSNLMAKTVPEKVAGAGAKVV